MGVKIINYNKNWQNLIRNLKFISKYSHKNLILSFSFKIKINFKLVCYLKNKMYLKSLK